MLNDLNMKQRMDKEHWEAVREELQNKLTVLQQRIYKLKIPVVIVMEGWGASGKGGMISRLIYNLDPRHFSVYSIDPPSPDDKRYPWMRRFWMKLPTYGDMAIFDRSWYQELAVYEAGKLNAHEMARRYNQIEDFERQITDDGYVLLKFFLHITKGEQKRRLKTLESKKETRWRVTKADWMHHEQYGKYLQRFEEMIEQTDRMGAKWTLIEANNKRFATYKVFSTVINALNQAIEAKEALAEQNRPTGQIRTSADIVTQPIKRLREVELNCELDEQTYKTELAECKRKLFLLHNRLYQKKIPVILAFEGWDAAGKGGNIKRITQGLDPRGYEVIPVAAPSTLEKNHPHLWRFWNALPRDGHIAVFDRTWYGRVMVEHIEGFCTQAQWERAYDEINRFEKQLSQWGAIILKFWLHIDKEEQLKRFQVRQNTPEKQYKITDEDWRNREKWDEYEKAVDEMLARTNTRQAPWMIIESNNKRFARIKTQKAIIQAMEDRL